jgi:anti-sigma-K factor RskA
MKDRDMMDRTRIEELLADRATGDLSPSDAVELSELLREHPELDGDAYERTAGELAAGLAGLDPDTLPGELADRLVRDGEAFFTPAASRGGISGGRPPVRMEPVGKSEEPVGKSARAPWVAWSGWIVAAAASIAWLVALENRAAIVEPMVTPTVADVRSDLIERAANVFDWTATEDPAASGASGDVVWSDAAQTGVMRIAGLAANDPRVTQYQLWVFDEERDERFPVDGGVFDIPAGQGEVLVPIRVAVPVTKAELFAITVEKPGGVVVSDRERIVLVAQAT